MNDNIKNLYEAIKNEYDVGTEEDFRTSLKNAEAQKNLYNALKDSYDLGTEDDFRESLGVGNDEAAVTQQHTQPVMEQNGQTVIGGKAEPQYSQEVYDRYDNQKVRRKGHNDLYPIKSLEEIAAKMESEKAGSSKAGNGLISRALGAFGQHDAQNAGMGLGVEAAAEPLPAVKQQDTQQPLEDPLEKRYAQIVQEGNVQESPFQQMVVELLGSGKATTPVEAQQMAYNLNYRYADKMGASTVGKLLDTIGQPTPEMGTQIDNGWYNEGVQSEIEANAKRLGLNYDDYVRNHVKPAMQRELEQRYGYSEHDAKVLSGRMFENPEHVRKQMEYNAAGNIIGNFMDGAVRKEFSDLDRQASPLRDALDMSGESFLYAKREYNKQTDPDKILSSLLDKQHSLYIDLLTDSRSLNQIQARADALGIGLGDYLDQYVAPQLNNAIVEKFRQVGIERELPKDTMDYVLGGFEDSVGGMLLSRMMNGATRQEFKNEALAMTEAGENPYMDGKPGLLAQGGRLATGMAADFWLWGGWGKIGSKATQQLMKERIAHLAAERGVTEAVAYRLAEEEAGHYLKKGVVNNLFKHVPQSAITMSGAEATTAAVQGIRDRQDMGTIISNTVGQGVHGAFTGTAFGLTGGVMGGLTQGLTGAKRLVGKLAGLEVEAATLYTTEELARMANGEDAFENPFEGLAESNIKLGFIKASANPVGAIGRLFEAVRHPVEALRVATESQHTLTDEDVADIMSSNDGRTLMDALTAMRPADNAREAGMRLGEVSVEDAEKAAAAYREFMTDAERPWVRKQKVARLLGGMLPPPGLEVSAEQVNNGDGTWSVRTRDYDGQTIRLDRYDSLYDADVAIDDMERDLDTNRTEALRQRIDMYDAYRNYSGYLEAEYETAVQKMRSGAELTDGEKQVVYLHQHRGEMLDIQNKLNDGEELSEEENRLGHIYTERFNDYVRRGSASDAFTREWEKANGLPEGSVERAIYSPERDETQQRIADAYREAMEERIEELKNTRQERDDERTIEPIGAIEASAQPQPAEKGIDGVDGNNGSAGYERGKAAIVNGDGVEMRQIGHERNVADARIARMFSKEEAAAIYQAVESGDKGALAAVTEQQTEPAKRDAIMKLAEALDAARGMDAAFDEQTAGIEGEVRAEAERYQSEDGRIVPLTLADGSTAFLMNGDPENEYGTVNVAYTDEAGQVQHKQIAARDITSIGEAEATDAYVARRSEELRKEQEGNFKNQIGGVDLRTGNTVELTMDGQTAAFRIDGFFENGDLQLSDEDGGVIRWSKDFVLGMIRATEEKRVSEELDAEEKALKEAEKARKEAEKAEAERLKGVERDRRAQIEEIRGKVLKDSKDFKDGHMGVMGVIGNLGEVEKYLLEHFDSEVDADAFIRDQRVALRNYQRDEVQPKIDALQRDLDSYARSEREMTPEELASVIQQHTQLMRQQEFLNGQAQKLKDASKRVGKVYSGKVGTQGLDATDSRSRRLSTLQKARSYEDKLKKARELYAGDAEASSLFDFESMEPKTIEEYAAEFLGAVPEQGKGIIDFESLQEETGHGGRRVGGDSRGYSAYLAPKGKGESIKALAHKMWERLPEQLHENWTDQDCRNALIEVLSSAQVPTDIRDYILNDRINQAEKYLRAQEEYEEEQQREEWAEAHHLQASDREAYEASLDYIGEEYSLLTDDDIQKINAIFAEKYEQRDEQDRRSQEMDRQPVAAGDGGEGPGGQGEIRPLSSEILHTEDQGRPYGDGQDVGKDKDAAAASVVPDSDVAGGAQVSPTPALPSREGDFGPVYEQFRGKPKEAIAYLRQTKNGEAIGALNHKDVGDIDLVWGEEGSGKSDGYGLAKLVKYHSEVLDNLQEILDDMHVTKRSDNRVQLESDTHQAVVRLTWNDAQKNWLLTAFEKKNSALDNTTDTGETAKRGRQDDTATLQNTVSVGKDTENISNLQGNEGKVAAKQQPAEKSSSIQGIEGYDADEVLNAVRGDIEMKLEDAGIEGVSIKGMALHGSRMRGDAREDSDLDVVVEYEGDFSEDGLFNILNEVPTTIEGITVDINPITKGKSGTLEEYMKRSRKYDEEKTPSRPPRGEEYKGLKDFKERLATAVEETNTEPTEGQKEAGNYKKGHLSFGGYNFTVENPKGIVRSGKDASGKPWSITMHNTYGYLTGKGHLGKDGDHLDVFINDDADLDTFGGPTPALPTREGDKSQKIYIIDQVNADGSFDEHKIMWGFNSEVDAIRNYLMNHSRPWHGLGNITGVDKATFDKWVESSDRKMKPFAETRFGDKRDVAAKVMGEVKRRNGLRFDMQGNPVDANGKLIIEKVERIEEITDTDFTNPTRSIELPKIPQNVNDAIGAEGKPVIIKKNIFEKNANTHQFAPNESRDILLSALYNPDLVGQTQPKTRKNHWVAIKIDEKSPITVLEVNQNKDNVEVVGWYTLDDRNLTRIKRQAEREDGELLILTPKGAAASLSTLPSDLSAGKDTKKSSNLQGKGVKTFETTQSWRPKELADMDGSHLETLINRRESQHSMNDLLLEKYKGKKREQLERNNAQIDADLAQLRGEQDRRASLGDAASEPTQGYGGVVSLKPEMGRAGRWVEGDLFAAAKPQPTEKDLFGTQERRSSMAKIVSMRPVEPRLDNWGLTCDYPYLQSFKKDNPDALAAQDDGKGGMVFRGIDAVAVENMTGLKGGTVKGVRELTIPSANIDRYLPMLVKRGKRIAVIDPKNPPAKNGGGRAPSVSIKGDAGNDSLRQLLESRKNRDADYLRQLIRQKESYISQLKQGIPEEERLYEEWQRAVGTKGEEAAQRAYEDYYAEHEEMILAWDEARNELEDLYGELGGKLTTAIEKKQKRLEGMSDQELLDAIGKENSSDRYIEDVDREDCIEEYDLRHKEEYEAELESYMKMLDESGTELDDAYGMYSSASGQWSDGGYHSEERTKLRAQIDALEDYIERKEDERYERELEGEEEEAAVAQRQNHEEDKAAAQQQPAEKRERYEADKTAVRAHGYDLTGLKMRDLAEGETSQVERRYVENGFFSFTSGERVESAGDVAFMFRALEDAAVENSFMVLIKDGVPTVVHLAIGNYAGVMAPVEQAFVAAQAIEPDSVVFVHNHPSCALKASKEDKTLQEKIEVIFGSKARPGIIIDTKSGKYAEFSGNIATTSDRPQTVEKEVPVKVFSFSKQVFDKDWDPEEAFQVGSSIDIAAFVSSHRLGDHPKMSLLVLNNQRRVTGNIFLPWTSLEDACSRESLLRIATYVNQMGGNAAVVYGDFLVGGDSGRLLRGLSTNLKGFNVRLVDVMNFENRSAYESGVIAMESQPEETGHEGSGVGRSLSDAEADALVEASMRRAEAMPLLELTPENWKAEFGSKGTVETPLGMVKLGANQYRKMEEKGRSKEFALIKPTLTNPDFIIEEVSEGKEGKTSRSSSYLYAKAFVGSNGKKQYFFKSVTVDQDGMEVNVSNYLDRAKRVKKSLMEGKLLWKRSELASDSSDVNQGLYNRPGNVSEPNTEGRVNPQSTLSIGKDREKSSNYQENGEKSLMGVHNISEEKLRKVLRQGGLANPSLAVIDTRNHIHTDYGEISLIPRSSLIDAKKGRNAGTWTADAWTPTYPEVTKRMSSKGQDRYWKETRKVLGDEPGDIRSKTMMAFESWMNRGIDPDRLSYWYLKERGRKPEQVMYEPSMVKEDIEAYHQAMGEHDRFSELDEAGRKAVLALIAKDRGETPDEMAAKMQELKERNLQRMNDENVKSFVKMLAESVIGEIDEYGVPYSYISDYDYKVRNSERTDGKLNVDATIGKAAELVKAEGLEEDFGKWLEEKEKAYGIEEWLYNGTDSEGRQKWVRNTLENASKLMKKQGRNGAHGMATGNLIATVAKRVTTLDQIRKERGNLNTTLEEHEAFKEQWGDALLELCNKCGDDLWVGEARLQEALGEKNPVVYLKKEYGVELSKEDAELLNTFIKEVRENFPTGYFETKFERPVGLDEFAVAVVPEATSPEVVKALKDAGLDVRTYDNTGTLEQQHENRRKAVMDAVKDRDDIMFSVNGGGAASEPRPADKAARELATKAVMQLLDGTGVNYHVVSQEEAQAVLRKAQGDGVALSRGKKRALKTVSIPKEEDQQTVVSSADGAKIRNNLDNGLSALQKIANGAENVPNAMTRDDLAQYGGDNQITFVYGKTGDTSKNFKGGYGLSHIGGKHGAETVLHVLKVIATGDIDRYVKGNKTVVLTDGEYEVLLGLTRFGEKETWLFNGWKKDEKTGADGEVSTHSDATQANPTFSREDLGAVLSDANIEKILETSKKTVGKVATESQHTDKEPLVTSEGVVYGYTDGEDIYLTPDGINPETPAHEYGHLWVKAVKKNRPDLWENIKDLMKEDAVSQKIYRRLLGDEAYRQIHGDEDKLYEEVLTQMGGQKNRERFEQAAREVIDEAPTAAEAVKVANVISRIRRAFRKLWDWIGKSLFQIKKFRSVDEVTDRMMYDFVEGNLAAAKPLPAEKEAAQPEFQVGKGKPRKMKGEGMAHYFERLREWDQREKAKKEAEADGIMEPSRTEADAKAHAEWARDHAEWEQNPDGKAEPMEWDYAQKAEKEYREALQAYEEKIDGYMPERTPELTKEDVIVEREMQVKTPAQKLMNDISEHLAREYDPYTARDAVMDAVIQRRKDIEEVSADDSIYIEGIRRETNRLADELMKKMGVEGARLKTVKLLQTMSDGKVKPQVTGADIRRALSYFIEAPMRRRDIANEANEALEHLGYPARFTADNIKRAERELDAIRDEAQELLALHKEMAEDGRTEMTVEEQGLYGRVREGARKVADAMNGGGAAAEPQPTGKGPRIGADDIMATLSILTKRVKPEGLKVSEDMPELQPIIGKAKDWYAVAYGWLEDAGMRPDDIGYYKDYVNHVWDKERSDPEAYERYVANRQPTKSRNMRKREIRTLMDGEELGLVPKYDDIADLMGEYSKTNIQSWANKKMLVDLSGIDVVERDDSGEPTSMMSLLTSRTPSAFDMDKYDYFEIAGVGPVWVHKAAAKNFGLVFETYEPGKLMGTYDKAASIAKNIELAWSGFHAAALTEVYVAQNVTRPKRAMQNFYKYLIHDSLLQGQAPAYADPELYKDAARHLVKLGATGDYAPEAMKQVSEQLKDFFGELRMKMEAKGGLGKAVGMAVGIPEVVATAVKLVNEGMDKALWTWLHDGLKLCQYRMFREDVMAKAGKEGWSQDRINKALDEAGQYINDEFGGQHFEVIGVSPKTLRMMRRFLLSPDWLLSTQRHFLATFGFGSIYNKANVRNFRDFYRNVWHRGKGNEGQYDGRYSRAKASLACYVLGCMIMYPLVMNALNALLRKKDEEYEAQMEQENPGYVSKYKLAYPEGMKGFEWDNLSLNPFNSFNIFGDYGMGSNAEGKKSHLFAGRYGDDTEMYIRWGKQFREFPELFETEQGELGFPGPLLKRLMGKSNPNIRFLYDTLNYYTRWDKSKSDEDLEAKWKAWIGDGKLQRNIGIPVGVGANKLWQNYLPFWVPTQSDKEWKPTDMILPSTKGFTPYKARNYFMEFIKAGDEDGIKETFKASVLNGMTSAQISRAFDAARKAVENESRELQLKDGNDIHSVTEAFDASQDLKERKELNSRIRKMLAADAEPPQDWNEFMTTVRAERDGTTEGVTKASEKYLMVATSADVLEDARLAQLKKKASEMKRIHDGMKDNKADRELIRQWEQQNQKWLDAGKMIKDGESGSESKQGILFWKKKLTGKEANDRKALEMIRKKRKSLLKAVGERVK